MTKCQVCNMDQMAFNFKLCWKHGFMICPDCAREMKVDENGSYHERYDDD